jgi:hypothetical protein
MANPRAFLSFDYDHDLTEKNLFAGQCAKDSPTPFTAEDWSSKENLPQDQWEAQLKKRINSCHMAIVLVGKYMGTATGVVKEIKMAQSQNVPFFGVYVNGADESSTLPSGLSRARTVKWKWSLVGGMVDQMMTEGKNKKSY